MQENPTNRWGLKAREYHPDSLARMVSAARDASLARDGLHRGGGVAFLASVGLDTMCRPGQAKIWILRSVELGGPRSTWVVPWLRALDAPPRVALYELSTRLRVSQEDALAWAAKVVKAGKAPPSRLGQLRVPKGDVLTWCEIATRA